MNIEEMRVLYPNEWVLVGNPEMDSDGLEVLSGIPLFHSKDKKEVCYLGRDKAKEYQNITLSFMGELPHLRRTTGIFNRVSQ
jgi:hypothetical protein